MPEKKREIPRTFPYRMIRLQLLECQEDVYLQPFKEIKSVELTPELEADIEKDFEEVMKTHVVYDGFFLCKGHCCSEYHELSVTHWFLKKLEGLRK